MSFVFSKKVLDHGFVQLVESWGSEESIIEAARMSTQKGFLGWGPKHDPSCAWHTIEQVALPPEQRSCTCEPKVGDEKLLAYLWKNKHATPFEMAGATFEVQAPIFVFREWHRHRVPFGYNEMSARYAPLPDVNYVPTVERLLAGGGHLTKQAGSVDGAGALTEDMAVRYIDALTHHYEVDEKLYQVALSMGVPKELARIHLPVGRYSRMRATSNLRGWLAFLDLRMQKNAQYEIRCYADAVHEALSSVFPRVLDLFDEGRA